MEAVMFTMVLPGAGGAKESRLVFWAGLREAAHGLRAVGRARLAKQLASWRSGAGALPARGEFEREWARGFARKMERVSPACAAALKAEGFWVRGSKREEALDLEAGLPEAGVHVWMDASCGGNGLARRARSKPAAWRGAAQESLEEALGAKVQFAGAMDNGQLESWGQALEKSKALVEAQWAKSELELLLPQAGAAGAQSASI